MARRLFVDNFSAVLSILQYTCPQNILRTKLLRNSIFHSLFLDIDCVSSDLLAFCFQLGCQNCMLRVFMIFFRLKKLERRIFFHLFRSLNGKFSAFRPALSSENFKIASMVSTRKFWQKELLVKIIVLSIVLVLTARIVWPSGKNLLTGMCLNRILRVHKNNFKKKNRRV